MEKPKILIVEDEGLVARDLEAMIRNLGYRVVGICSSAEEAFRLINTRRPDLIIMDIVLQGKLDGIKAADEIRRRHNLPIIFLTAHTDETTFQRAKVTNPLAFIHKPVEQKELLTVIEMALYKHRTEMKLREKEEWLSTILAGIADGVIATDPHGIITFMNPVAADLTGWNPEGGLSRRLEDVVLLYDGDKEISFYLSPQEIIDHDGFPRNIPNLWIVNQQRKTPVEIKASVIRDENGAPAGLVILLHNITERRQHEEELRRLAIHDSLTGLPNRLLFFDRLNLALCHGRRHGHRLAILMLDLDHYKKINDTYGHSIGDLLLKEVGKRLQGAIRSSDTVARFGGDEFVLLMPEINNPTDAAQIAKRILETISLPFEINGIPLLITVSIGIAIFPEDGEDRETLITKADLALYAAKDKGRNCFFFYSQLQKISD
ncbi:MAG: diguanylate cyclase [Candidatus Aminicenantes bacterium]|nr:diguanylate cyclase [Candidatus Aminicenantes bacterium]